MTNHNVSSKQQQKNAPPKRGKFKESSNEHDTRARGRAQ
jgi:hypothetical protein